jgi:hypothetical protein
MLQGIKSLSIVRDAQCQVQERVDFDRLLLGISCGALLNVRGQCDKHIFHDREERTRSLEMAGCT